MNLTQGGPSGSPCFMRPSQGRPVHGRFSDSGILQRMPTVQHASRDLMTIRDLSRDEIDAMLDAAAAFRPLSDPAHRTRTDLAGATVVNLFFENSTRTRTSFEIAAKRLGATVINFDIATSSVSKGESLVDTIRTIEAMSPDAIVMRHSSTGAPAFVKRHTGAAVINAGDGAHEHPTQALLDVLTMRDRLGSMEGRCVAIIGDVRHSRVARSNVYCLQKLGARVKFVGPRAFVPETLRNFGVELQHDLRAGIADVDVIYLLRIQLERQAEPMFPSGTEYHRLYGLNECTLRFAPEHALVMHPGPVNRGVEINSGLMTHERCLIEEQVANGVAVRMAVLARAGRRSDG